MVDDHSAGGVFAAFGRVSVRLWHLAQSGEPAGRQSWNVRWTGELHRRLPRSGVLAGYQEHLRLHDCGDAVENGGWIGPRAGDEPGLQVQEYHPRDDAAAVYRPDCAVDDRLDVDPRSGVRPGQLVPAQPGHRQSGTVLAG